MRRNVLGVALGAALLSLSPLAASAAIGCDLTTFQKAAPETATLVAALNAKQQRLHEQLFIEGAGGLSEVDQIEVEIKGLKKKIEAAAQEKGVTLSCWK